MSVTADLFLDPLCYNVSGSLYLALRSVGWSVDRLVDWSVSHARIFLDDLYVTWHANPKSDVHLSLSRQVFEL